MVIAEIMLLAAGIDTVYGVAAIVAQTAPVTVAEQIQKFGKAALGLQKITILQIESFFFAPFQNSLGIPNWPNKKTPDL